MKTLLVVAVAALCATALWNQKPKQDPVLLRHEQAIAEHRVTLSMTREEVTRSLGEPDTRKRLDETDELWKWKSGRWVKFTGRALVDSGIEAPAAKAPAPQPGYHYERSPANGNYVPVRDGSSWRQSVGGG